ncbi:MAG TPA: hypothetical protein VGD69_12740 [Herpetosiphonaceae bacterium]
MLSCCEQNAQQERTMSLDQAITSLQQDLARLAQMEYLVEEPPGDAAQLARLQAAPAALKLAAVLLDDADPIAAAPIWEQFNAVSLDLATWQRNGRGWFEERLVRRGQKVHGPYRYFRWRDEAGKTHTRYLGRIEALPAVQPAPPIPASLHPAEPSTWRGRVQPVRIGSTKKVHLMLPEPGETTTLCGRPLGAQPLRAIVFQYDDCARCRTAATKLGRICAECGNPLVMQAGPAICVHCALRSTTD